MRTLEKGVVFRYCGPVRGGPWTTFAIWLHGSGALALTAGTLPREATDVLGGVGAAYSVQREMVTLASLPRAGWKVGATNAAMQTLFGIDEPASAPMFQPFCFASPAELAVFPDQGASVECEFAFLFARDLPPRSQAYTRAEVLDAVEALVPAIEVVGCRFAGGFGELGGVRLVADMSGNSAFVAGPRTADWQAVDVKGQGVRLFVNDAFVVEGVGANALGDPLSRPRMDSQPSVRSRGCHPRRRNHHHRDLHRRNAGLGGRCRSGGLR